MTAQDSTGSVAREIAIVGSGYMGGGIAQVLALAGARVRIADISEEIAVANHARLLEEAARFVADGLFPSDAVERIRAAVTPAASIEEAVAGADFIEEAVPEKLEIKHATLRRISAAARPDAVIGSNTSTILIGSLAEAVTNPERFLGVHFSNPAPFIPGVELIPHAGTAESAIAMAEAMGERIDALPGFRLVAPVRYNVVCSELVDEAGEPDPAADLGQGVHPHTAF
jgi:3-hydroxybutyryl-CoA dehydrogenase